MSLKRATTANAQVKNVVFGFIRNHEKREFISVPDMIKYLILNYYLLREAFGNPGNKAPFKLSDDLTVATFDPRNPGVLWSFTRPIVGRLPINYVFEGVAEYRWTLEIVQCGGYVIEIGLGAFVDGYYNPDYSAFFGIQWYSDIIRSVLNDQTVWSKDTRGCPNNLEQGVIVEITLDTEPDILHFHINGKHVKSIQRNRNAKFVDDKRPFF